MYIDVILLSIISLVAFIISCIIFAAASDSGNYSFKSMSFAAFFMLLALSGTGWLTYAGMQPAEINEVEYYDIKWVVYPDGTKQQMYTMNGSNYKVYPIVPDNWKTKVIRYKQVYGGINFHVNSNITYVESK